MNVRQLILGDLDTNCYLVWGESGQALVIDPADDADAILAAVNEEEITVVAVVLTHVHFDHMLAAEALCAAVHAPLYVGAGDSAALKDPIRNLSGWFSPDHPVTIDGGETINEGERMEVGDLTFTVLETPGHTPGCICLLSDRVLFAGDTLFQGSIGRLDFPGGNPAAMAESLGRLMTLPDETVVYSGHGAATTIGREKKYNPYIR